MNKEKQIEEIFNDVIESEHRFHEYCLVNTCHDCEYYGDGECDNHIRAEYLYNAGYRKQSEGEWVKTQFVARSGFYTIKEFPCNQCGERFEVAKGNELMHFCPNCGAKMKGGAE